MTENTGHAKRGNSIIWKLVFLQTGRMLWVFTKLNFAAIIICAVLLMMWAEWQLGNSAEVKEIASPNGIQLHRQIERHLWLPHGSYRSFEITESPERYPAPPGNPAELYYVAAIPAENGRWHETRLDIGTPAWFILIGFAVIFLLEIWYVLQTMLAGKREVRRILRPIYDLTMTAQSMTYPQAIPLDGTIDALNAITEEHLDRRISIEDERDELKGLASAINSMLDRLDAAYKSQLRFVSDASHELRTPIAIIQGYANLLSRWGKDDPKALQESIDAIKSESVGMQLLIEQLLFLARSDNRSIPLHLDGVDVSALAAEVAKDMRILASIHEIEEKIEPGLSVMGDIQLLKQAVRILVDNSIKYSPEGGRIVIGVTSHDDGNLRIRV
ncbi:MAG: HAMP domain-containing histidine kinase, partial [Oscillospiraceae bacterium]|nr:HAMP domain-containing histidine kinase [Oscillospiraceae bacterium]